MQLWRRLHARTFTAPAAKVVAARYDISNLQLAFYHIASSPPPTKMYKLELSTAINVLLEGFISSFSLEAEHPGLGPVCIRC